MINKIKKGDKILIVYDSERLSGVGTVHKNLSSALESLGFEVIGLSQSKLKSDYGINMIQAPVFKGFEIISPNPVDLRKARKAFSDFLKQTQPDAILVLTPEGSVGRIATIVLEDLGVPFTPAYTTHSHKFMATLVTQKVDLLDMEKSELLNYLADQKTKEKLSKSVRSVIESFVWQTFVRGVFDRFDKLLVPSPQAIDELIELGLIESDQAVLWPRGIDHGVFRPLGQAENNFYRRYEWYVNKKPLIAVFHSRLDADKELDDLPLQINKIKEKDLHWVLIGKGSELERLKSENKKRPWVHILGYLSHENGLGHALRSADLGYYANLKNETNGNVVIEAISSGIPVVASDKGATKYHVEPGQNGVILKDDDYEYAIKEALKILGKRARQDIADTLSDYSWENSAQILIENLNKINWHKLEDR